jgi:hypothetical protein
MQIARKANRRKMNVVSGPTTRLAGFWSDNYAKNAVADKKIRDFNSHFRANRWIAFA